MTPHDFIARHVLHTASHLTTSITLFGAVYLLSHGIAKIVLVGLVLRDKLWAYPWLIALLLAFIGYYLPASVAGARLRSGPRPGRGPLQQRGEAAGQRVGGHGD